MRRSSSRLLLLAVTALAGLVGPPLEPGYAGRVPTRLAWATCAEAPDDPAVRCATVAVPVDWDRPRGATVDLVLARREAADPASRIGVLLFDLGGPGSSGVDAVLGGGPRFSDEIRRRFDVVGVDPRGIGRSHPVLCSPELIDRAPLPYPADQAELDRIIVHNGRVRADCRARTGALFDHVDTLSVARDLDAIRAALGEARLTFYGVSYGTMLAGQYAELFPHRVRAMVLDSIVDHSLGTRELLDAGAVAVEDSYDQFADWCDGDPTCALYGRVRSVTAELFARTERGEIIIPGETPRPATPFDLVEAFQQSLRVQIPVQVLWPTLAQAVLDLYHELPVSTSDSVAPGVPYPGRAVRCQDFLMPLRDHADLMRHLRRSLALAPDMRFGADRLDQVLFCQGTPTPIANPQHRLWVRTAVPLLLVNNRHDPITGYTMATGVAAQLGANGRLLTSEEWGHGVYSENACTTGAIDRYLVSLTLPAPGASCPAAPFEPGALRGPGVQDLQVEVAHPGLLGHPA